MNTASAWLRSSFRGTAATAATGHSDGRSLDGGPLMDPNVCFETFQRHWQQLRDITTAQDVPSADDVVAMTNLLDQMTSLLEVELTKSKDDTLPCLDLLLSENVLAHILATSRMPIPPPHQDRLRLEQLKLYETILRSSPSATTLLPHQPLLRPLLDLLSEFESNAQFATSAQTEMHLVLLLNQLCCLLMDNMDLLDFFFQAASPADSATKRQFLIFTLLIDFLHKEGNIGQQARDSLLLCMSLSKKNDEVGKYIAKHTNFCPVLATGLSGLYSVLPRRLRCTDDPNWHRITSVDLLDMPELTAFLSSLEFCNAVSQVAHKSIREHLLGLIYMGFLVPVLGPALIQNPEAELTCSTAYVELFLRKITEPSLLAVFLRFIFTDACDEKSIIDSLTIRLSTQSKLCVVTLSLFETLVNLNCEDVMFWLIFRHLIPLKHLLPSQKGSIRQADLHGRAAEKLLSLTPICCHPLDDSDVVASPSSRTHGPISLPHFLVGLRSPSSDPAAPLTCNNYQAYLHDAKQVVRLRYEATQCWAYEYDGINPPPEAMEGDARNGIDGDNKMPSSGYNSMQNPKAIKIPPSKEALHKSDSGAALSLGGSGPMSLTEEEDQEFWNLMKEPTVSESRLNAAILKMQSDDLSLSSGALSLNGSSHDDFSPREFKPIGPDIDMSITSLGPFLDFLFEKIELLASNDLCISLGVTSLLSSLASFPQPLLRSVLLHPDVVFQPSVRGLYQAIAALRQKLDNIMPTLIGTDEAVAAARKFLAERIVKQDAEANKKRRESTVSIMSTVSQIGADVTKSRGGIFSYFRSKKSEPSSAPPPSEFSSLPASPSLTLNPYNHLSREVRQHALAAVLLEEWLQELAAIAQEQSVLQKELTFSLGFDTKSSATISTTNNDTKS